MLRTEVAGSLATHCSRAYRLLWGRGSVDRDTPLIVCGVTRVSQNCRRATPWRPGPRGKLAGMITTRHHQPPRLADWRAQAGHPRLDAATLVGVNVSTLDRRIRDKTIRAVKVGRLVIVPTSEIQRLLGEVPAPVTPPEVMA